MHNLEESISEWRKSPATNVSAETLDELETHLRETTEQPVRSGMNPADAFQRALADLGNIAYSCGSCSNCCGLVLGPAARFAARVRRLNCRKSQKP
jgi:hypothetical protein